MKEKFFKPGEMFSVRVPGLKYPVFLRAKTSDIEVFCQIMVHAELDFPPPEEVRYIVDAGANIGLSSIFMALKFPGAVIDAVEVADANIPVLRKNTAFYPQINIYPMGLWFRSAKLKIINPEAEPWAFIVEETDDADPFGISTIGVDDIIKMRGAERIDILKVDIEGGERDLFQCADWIKHVRCLAIELHDHIKPGCHQAVDDAVRRRIFDYQRCGEYHIYSFR